MGHIDLMVQSTLIKIVNVWYIEWKITEGWFFMSNNTSDSFTELLIVYGRFATRRKIAIYYFVVHANTVKMGVISGSYPQ